ncbi:phage tail protein [Herbaspirillum seropedicae]|uniref:Microcystin-dependent protein n=1 Tax=Herbaspirillum seropedicae (strain SmR1) TaxID=757424 RepID=D8J0W0_HERSS|nr:tail fiber protein [Herbaspirillum seropedicae]ADJ62515.1 microcystin-dependent protein [Herbaspirillum seropedicae SmR1]
MHYPFRKASALLALASGLMTAAWAPNSFACSDTPVLASVCIMAVPPSFGSFNRQYVLAAGQQLSINQYTALYSLIGITYGGNAQTTFNLPDLRGRVLVGANGTTFPAGATGGNTSINLSIAQLPPHNFVVAAIPVDLSRVTATTMLSGLSATTNLSGVTIAGTPSGLTIAASSTNGGVASPDGNYLGKPAAAAAAAYTSVAPNVTLNSASIGGQMSMTISNAATAPVSITSGGATTAIGGSATATGVTNTLGTGAAIPTMPPYLAMTYYIAAANGIYPSRD